MADTKIIYGGIMFFIVLGLVMGFFSQKLNSDFASPDYDEFEKDLKEDVPTSSWTIVSTTGNLLISILKASFWTFGTLPFIVDLVFLLPIRILFWFTVVRQIGGSGN